MNDYITAALSTAKFEGIEEKEPYYGEIPSLPGFWSTGDSLKECKKVLLSVVKEWIALWIRFG
ncbi:protein of unknown function UPF0150 [Methanospirillum hungatei JF-1]|uniref:HicB-like antitoxin of toxin-antitoxin system domain-containing protein n=1 Tax=Methanospirillum hungatei JF-1 (strain ATCC 27890 / DSM 864 / NBRC 100397 / JF-1) TaxID=323259 RepID=Q2FTZ2_METHJ|nr:type II toxin-antitoxin system HicB family antitoxin [Methanospirillum hungatei]ABD42415.1 protein of unknown function UPF0150 [Methanospirillum hungatei JF-1]MBP9008634.1 type II toxin-antitoxin system HicB family antitoxin [Methanospirillum sp.]HOW04477.1 type II toxin-antitoxin system HicB family antitoxin [Methanospirillum hungatei]